jgi:hypothetical protein
MKSASILHIVLKSFSAWWANMQAMRLMRYIDGSRHTSTHATVPWADCGTKSQQPLISLYTILRGIAAVCGFYFGLRFGALPSTMSCTQFCPANGDIVVFANCSYFQVRLMLGDAVVLPWFVYCLGWS